MFIYIYIYIYIYANTNTYIHTHNCCQPSWNLDVSSSHNWFFDYFVLSCYTWKLFQGIFGILFYLTLGTCINSTLYYRCSILLRCLGRKISICINFQYFETLKILNHRILMMDIARQIRHMYNKERKCAPFFKKLTYKYIIMNWYFKIQECCMFPLMFRFYF